MESELNSFQTRIFDIRGRKVMIDVHLAEAYGVTTKRLREQVRRNPERFPLDFMFILDKEEVTEVAAKCGDLPNLKYFAGIVYAFTEHGTVMLASVLKSQLAIKASLIIVRAFVLLKELSHSNHDMIYRVTLLEERFGKHDTEIQSLFQAIRELMSTPPLPDPPPRKKVGYKRQGEE